MKAFPNHRSEGMDLRDYFAIKILQGEISNDGLAYGDYADENNRILAKHAYKLADVMMKERENNAKPE